MGDVSQPKADAKGEIGACSYQRCHVPQACPFDCLAITAPNPRASKAYLEELVHRVGVSAREGTKEVLILAVSDPEGVRIGSGGGTLNAILEIDQALRGATPTGNPPPPQAGGGGGGGGLATARVLLVHSGGDSQRSPTQCVCGKAWSALNSCGNNSSNSNSNSSRCNTPMDLLLDHLSRLFSGDGAMGGPLDPGTLVVTACDVMLLIPPEVAATADWSFDKQGGVAGLAIAADAAKYAPNHGVYCLDGGEGGGGGHGKHGISRVSKYLQKPSFQEAEASGAFLPGLGPSAPEVAIDSGVVVFSGEATSALARLAYSDTFKGCTARGVAEGASALRLELYSDLLLALKTGAAAGGSEEGGLDTYLAGCGPALPMDHPLSRARRETWDALRGFPLGAMLLTGATFVHLGTTPELMEMMTLRLPEFVEPYGLTARAASVIGGACSVEDDPPAVVVNSRLAGAGVVAGGAVVEHCRLDGDGWEVGAGSLMSGVRSLKADHRLRLRSGMCLQQTDLTSSEESTVDGKATRAEFVVSMFGARDDIKAHYAADRARVCGATWEAFLGYAGATVEDVWGGVNEADRKLWSARLFPVLTHQQDEGQAANAAVTNAAGVVMWMQDVQEHASAATSSSAPAGLPQPPPVSGEGGCSAANNEDSQNAPNKAAAEWLAAERLSFKEILARADPGAEFKWRRKLEEGMVEASGGLPSAPQAGGGGEVGGGRCRAWDAVAIIAPTMEQLGEAHRSLGSPTLTGGQGATTTFFVPPPRPFDANTLNEGMGSDGPLILNGLLVVAERYSALKRARFGSETSSEALRGMRVLLRLQADAVGGVPESPLVGAAKDGVWVQQRDGTMIAIREELLAALLKLCQSDPRYQGLTYLGADNAISAPEAPPGPRTAFDFLATAAEAASTPPPPAPVPQTPINEAPGCAVRDGASAGTASAVDGDVIVRCLEELDERAAGEACTPAGAAQALARVACRLYDLADDMGGGGHRSGPGEHPEWQASMMGLGTLRPLPGCTEWGPPAALPSAVAALRRLRERWLGGAADPTNAAAISCADPHLVVRCARHYERAAAVVVSAAVLTASLFVEPPPPAWGLSRAGESFQDTPGDGSEPGSPAAEGEDAGKEEEEEEQKQHREREEWQAKELSDRISRMNPREQAMARHSQVHANHRKVVANNAKRTQQRYQEGRQRWELHQQGRKHQSQQQQHALPVGASVTSRAAARIDLAGGWTDTPPISYEAGGSVVNVAVTVSGERPVEARCERIEARSVELVCEARDGTVTSRTVCSSVRDFEDFCVPQAPAALLKAALICAGIVCLPHPSATATAVSAASVAAAGSSPNTSHPAADLPPKKNASDITANVHDGQAGRPLSSSSLSSLEEQLGRVFGSGGIRITSRSGLPQGSGMGTSSILAGAVLSAACVAAGRAMSPSSLVHAVLRVEQLMTAGGGHQDQVGGLLGGVKICRTAPSLPLQVLTETIPLDPSFEEALNDRLVLVFTGKQRLARDLLQGVVRGWHDRLPGTVNAVKGLVSNAEEAASVCRGAGNLEALGRCLSTYWEQKKRMAPGAEPPAVKALLDKMRPLCYGLSVCGAGGGGFVAGITKSPGDQGMKDITNALTPSSSGSSEVSTVSVHRGRLDPVGMEVSIELPAP
eukprot:g16748.t1